MLARRRRAGAEHGLVALHGFSPGVGVAGYLLGGGLGWLARREGFASGRVRSFDVVTAAGERLQVDAGASPICSGRCAAGAAARWSSPRSRSSCSSCGRSTPACSCGRWSRRRRSCSLPRVDRDVPDAVTSTVKLLRFPPLPEVPDPLRGRALVAITLAFTGRARGRRAGGAAARNRRAYLDTLAIVPAAALGELAGDPPARCRASATRSCSSRSRPTSADAFVELAGPGRRSPLIQLEIRHLGGALPCRGRSGAAGALEAEVIVYGVGLPVTPEVGPAIEAPSLRSRPAWSPGPRAEAPADLR